MNSMEMPKLIHVGRIISSHGGSCYLYLRQQSPQQYSWYQGDGPTAIFDSSFEKAIQQARRHWKENSFRLLHCGFRYTLPERDEHGCNALFCQMAASYSSPNGVYFDEDLGHNCIVHFASQEALDLLRKGIKK